MKVNALRIENFRTLESATIDLSSAYTAICGANDSGKTNAIRALRVLFREESPLPRYLAEREDISLKDDFTKWKDLDVADRHIEIGASISVHRDRDAGLYQSIVKQLSIEDAPDPLELDVKIRHVAGKSSESVSVRAHGVDYDDLDAQEVLNRIQTARTVLFHNSTENHPRARFAGALGYIQDPAKEDLGKLEKSTRTLNKALRSLARGRQKEIESLLGRLESKYKVGVSLPMFEPEFLPFSITLGERSFEVPLDDWGSGTKNRTLILLLLFAARQVSTAEATAAKVTPIIVVEEPESFLHPSAQAEFGRVLQDLAREFDVQVIVTTHSPYMLSMKEPAANVLLRREVRYNKLRETCCAETVGEHWMDPFAQALGLDSEAFKPWKQLFLNSSDSVLLVEGDIDKEYLELLRGPAHKGSQLLFAGDIVPYDGTGSLQNTVLLRLLRNRCRQLFVTFDLDSESQIAQKLQTLGLEKRKDYLAIGVNAAGRRNIEGLLPDEVKQRVRTANPQLVDAAESGTPQERKDARSKLKKLYLDDFRTTASPGSEAFSEFYALAKALNKALCRPD